jgi:hypothetical protein
MGLQAVRVKEAIGDHPAIWALTFNGVYFRADDHVIGWSTKDLAEASIPDAIGILLDTPAGRA